ncbi:Hypothetical predicted protein [Mytilus galloprovincialis]|uniref:Septin-type G domain-containing protein n=1 Tax=Mytilus galloprovincialis TaxID=29158 RepID=A0A8B6H558_MYTGA|nr:Hypothetical predicted protein [Mytilus galloprovincialis]
MKTKCIMLVGATGSGKSTLVNAVANYIIGVRREDICRFEMVQLEDNERGRSGAQSQTQWVTCYTIYINKTSRLSYNVTIIDTPGFGHTEGLQSDGAIVDQIRELFLAEDGKGVTCIDAICFVVKSPDARLTFTQEYIFRSILALFGKDIEGNICTIVTFADGQEPPVIQALSQLDEKPIPYETYFPVNNSAIFSSNSDQNPTSISTKFFWTLAMESYDNFFKHIHRLHPKSLSLTTEVLCLRQAKENTIYNLQIELDRGFIKLDSIHEEVQIFKQHTREIKDNKDFKYEVEESKFEKVDIGGQGIYTTNCLTCNYTCHANCAYANDDDKAKCIAMNADGKCTECPNKCYWKLHHNVPFVFKVVKTKVTKTYREKEAAYQAAKKKKLSQKDIVEILHNEIGEIQENIDQYLYMITQHSNHLKRIALLPNTLSTVQYIDLLIEAEKQIKKEGFESRIKELGRCRDRAMYNTTVKNFASQIQIAKDTIQNN